MAAAPAAASDRSGDRWAWEENGLRGRETLVEIEFAPAGRNTPIVLTQREFETREACDNHDKGWTSTIAKLETFLQGG